MLRLSIAVSFAAAIVTLAGTSAASGGRLPRVLQQNCGRTFAVRPRWITFTCDGSGATGGERTVVRTTWGHFGQIQWRTWTTTEAVGRAVEWTKDIQCPSPSGPCHASYVQKKGVFEFRLWRVRHGRFTRADYGRWTLRLDNGAAGYFIFAAFDRIALGPISSMMPTLRNAAALGTLVRLDPHSQTAEFRIKCGWHYSPKKKIRAGLWKVSLHGKTFGWETNLLNPAASDARVRAISLAAWEQLAESNGWTGTLRLSQQAGNISNGPTTDICAGTLG